MNIFLDAKNLVPWACISEGAAPNILDLPFCGGMYFITDLLHQIFWENIFYLRLTTT